MDDSVALVESYLRVNGYLTVAEHPVVEVARGAYRQATDLDLLAFRFPGAGRFLAVSPAGAPDASHRLEPDPALGVPVDRGDMLVAEVKEGQASLNRAARRPAVLRAALRRFGCCREGEEAAVVDELIRRGRATGTGGHQIRLVAFGSAPPENRAPIYHIVLLDHVVRFLRAYLIEHWEVLRHARIRDPGLALLALLEKALPREPPSA